MKKNIKKAVKQIKAKKYLLLGVAVVVFAFGVYKVAFPPCAPLTNEALLPVFISCLGELNSDATYEQACKEIRNEGKNCQFEEKDEDALNAFAEKFVFSCLSKGLEKDNICTDKLKDTLAQ
jgi:hypothetical protein